MSILQAHYPTEGQITLGGLSYPPANLAPITITEPTVAHNIEAQSQRRNRTPPNIEALLRLYNSQGTTKWKAILERLKNEMPPIYIKRSKLGAYLKEYNLGTSRREHMPDDEKRQIVLTELEQSRSLKRGVRKVWENLKSNGHHIKRDFVERVMKEVDPDGFSKRRPKWKSLSVVAAPLVAPVSPPIIPIAHIDSSNLAVQNDSLPPTLPPSRTDTPPLNSDPSFPVFFRPLETNPALDVPAPRLYIPATNELPINNPSFPGLPMDTTQGERGTDTDYHYANSENSDSGVISILSLPDPPESSNVSRRSVEHPFFSNAFRADLTIEQTCFGPGINCPTLQDARENQEEHSGSRIANVELEMGGLRPHDQHLRRASSTASSNPDVAEQRSIIQRCQLQNTIDDLLFQLEDWCNSPLESTSFEPPAPIEFPTSAARGMPNGIAEPSNSGPTPGTQYIPYYDVSEDEVTNDALFIALTLQRTLSPPKSSARILQMVNQLRELQARLRDIGMSPTCLAELGLKRLNVLEILAQARSPVEWVLHDVWQCAADCTYDLQKIRPVHQGQRKVVARKASDAARQIISVAPMYSEFYWAASLHYQALCLPNGSEENVADALKPSLGLFAEHINPSCEHLREMIRTALSYFHVQRVHAEDEVAAIFLSRIVASAHLIDGDPSLVDLLLDLAQQVLDSWGGRQSHNIHFSSMVRLIEGSIQTLRSLQRARPTHFQPILARALELSAWVALCTGHSFDAIQALEDVVGIQRRLAGLTRPMAVRNLTELTQLNVWNQLGLGHGEQALCSVNRLVRLIRSEPDAVRVNYHLYGSLNGCLRRFRYFLKSIRSLQAVVVVCGLIDTVRPIVGSFSAHWHSLHATLAVLVATVSDVERCLGFFETALTTARDALFFSRPLKRALNGRDTMCYVKVLTSYAHCLFDRCAYEEAYQHLQEAMLVCKESQNTRPGLKDDYPEAWVCLFGLFGMVRTRLGISDQLSSIDEALAVSRAHVEEPATSRTFPWWLTALPGISAVGTTDAHACLVFQQTVIRYVLSPGNVQSSAEEALELLFRYDEEAGAHMKPYVRASVLGQRYILLCILGTEEGTKHALDETVAAYRSALATESHVARLPLLLFLDILLVLSRRFDTTQFPIPDFETWKKSVYNGSTSFFDELALFLQDLPRCLCAGQLLSDPA